MLNSGRHLHSAGRPSRWALAHILVSFSLQISYFTGHIMAYSGAVHIFKGIAVPNRINVSLRLRLSHGTERDGVSESAWTRERERVREMSVRLSRPRVIRLSRDALYLISLSRRGRCARSERGGGTRDRRQNDDVGECNVTTSSDHHRHVTYLVITVT